jgi:PPP family 3-phenylpropionic acid transporter
MPVYIANYFFLFATAAVFHPYFQLFLKARGFSLSQMGVLLACAQLAGMVGPLALGRAADRSGRFRRMLIACVSASTLAMFPLIFTNRFILVVPLVVLVGMSYHSLIPLTDALSNRRLDNPEQNWGRVRLFGTVSFILVSLLYRFSGLIDGSSSQSIFLNQAVLAALYFATLFLLPRRQESEADPLHLSDGIKLDRTFWLGIGIIFLASFSSSSYLSFLSLYLQESLGINNVSGMWAVSATIEIPVFFYAGRLIRRFGLRAMFLTAFAAIILRLLLYAIFPNRPAIVAAQLLHGITFGLFHATAVRWVSGIAGQRRIGAAMTIYSALGNGLALFFGSLVGGYLIEAVGFRVFYSLYSLPALIAIIILLAAGRRAGIP